MKCAYHLDRDAVGICNYCGKSICSDCSVAIGQESYCRECAPIKTGAQTKKEERSPALAAILSFVIAGLGQIYKGQILNGLVWLVVVVLGYIFLILPGIVLHLCCIFGAASGDPTKGK